MVKSLSRAALSGLLVSAIRAYQVVLGPLLGGNCRFTPSCSEYAIEAILKHGPGKGGWAAGRRLLRCHPFFPGGHDPVEQ